MEKKFNSDDFPILKKEYVVVCRYGDSVIYPLFHKESRHATSSYTFQTLNKTAAEILSFCNGENTVKDIIEKLRVQYNEKTDTVTEFVMSFLTESYEENHILISREHNPQKVHVYGDFSLITPASACIEITKQCPLACKHCYNNSGEISKNEMGTEQVYLALDKLSKLGVQRISITGGEPTQRNDFNKIVKFAADKFAAILILSNGYLITEEMARTLAIHNNVVVQISIDGLEENHNSLRGKKDAFEKTVSAIHHLTRNGLPVTVSTVITSENVEEIEDIARLVHQLGVISITFGIIINQGRARENNLAHGVDVEMLVQRALALKDFYKDKGMAVIIDDDTMHKLQGDENVLCGAGVNQIAVRENGDVSPCVSFFYNYGNILHDNLSDIFGPCKVSLFQDLPMPSKKLCGECVELENCNLCPANAYVSPLPEESCVWKKRFNQRLV